MRRGQLWTSVICGMLAAAAMLVAVASNATASELLHEASFEAECVLGPGTINIPGALQVTVSGEGPEQTREFALHNERVTAVAPGEWATPLHNGGVHEVRGFATRLAAAVENGSPAKLNLLESSEFPEGAPFAAAVVSEQPITLTAPSPAQGLTSPTITAEGSGPTMTISIDTTPGFEEDPELGYRFTGQGIQITISGYNEAGERIIGPLPTSCTAPAGVVLATVSTQPPPLTPCDVGLSEVTSVEPNHGPDIGGTTVTIKGCNFTGARAVDFGPFPAGKFTVNSSSSITAVSPGDPEFPPPYEVFVSVTTPNGGSPDHSGAGFVYEGSLPPPPPIEAVQYKNWTVSGSLTPRRLGQAIALPAGATFNGAGEVNRNSSAGSVTGHFAVPPLSASLRLFGLLPASFGLTLTEVGSASGTVAAAPSPEGDLSLALPVKANLRVTSVGLLGLRIPTSCATVEPLSLSLADTLTPEELFNTGWAFTGTATLPRFACEGGLLGRFFGEILSAVLSGPENAYSLRVSAPSG